VILALTVPAWWLSGAVGVLFIFAGMRAERRASPDRKFSSLHGINPFGFLRSEIWLSEAARRHYLIGHTLVALSGLFWPLIPDNDLAFMGFIIAALAAAGVLRTLLVPKNDPDPQEQ
jgi:hypothetical protein